MAKPKSTIKAYFETGDKPSQQNFFDLIDAIRHVDSGSVITSWSYDSSTGDMNISLSEGGEISFNVQKPTSEDISFITGLATALEGKVDKVTGKSLSSNDFTNSLKSKLEGLSNYTPPSSVPMSHVDGLISSLDSKAFDVGLVKVINHEGATYSPDLNGEVTIPSGNKPDVYDLSTNVSVMNYTYFGQPVYSILLPTNNVVNNELVFNHNLNIDRYLYLEERLSIDTAMPNLLSMRRSIGAQMKATAYSANSLAIEVSGEYTYGPDDYIYLEFTVNTSEFEET